MKPFRFYVKVLVALAIIIIPLLLVYPYLFKKIGYFLIMEQEPRRTDLIVVLNGRDTERSLAAVDLYKQGYSLQIIMARNFKQPGSDEFSKRAGSNFERKVFFQRAIEAMGVPEKSFQFIGTGVASTYDEALTTRDFVKDNGYKSILLVTSKWHSKRAYLTFRSALKKDGVKIIIQPSRYDVFNPDAWWKNRKDVELVFYEYVRLIFYVLSFRIPLHEIIL